MTTIYEQDKSDSHHWFPICIDSSQLPCIDVTINVFIMKTVPLIKMLVSELLNAILILSIVKKLSAFIINFSACSFSLVLRKG